MRFGVSFFYVLTFVVWSTECSTYPYGPSNGDTLVNGTSTQLNLLLSIPFLGSGDLSRIWINSVGALSYNEITDPRRQLLTQNIVLASLFNEELGKNSSIYYRQLLSDDTLFTKISRDVGMSRVFRNVNFVPTYALVVTWERMVSMQNTSTQNIFQIVVTSDGVRSYAIYNYDFSSWEFFKSETTEAGIFVAGDVTESCDLYILGDANQNVSRLLDRSKYSVRPGRHVIDITDPLKCTTFTGPCPDFPENERGMYQFFFENTRNNSLGWNFYAVFTCQATFSISPGVTNQTIQCLYDSDYYEYNWDQSTFSCMDFNATRQFVTTVGVLRLNDPMVVWFNDGKPTEEFLETIKESVNKLFVNIDVTGVFNEIVDIINGTDPDGNENNTTRVDIGIISYIPPSTNRKLTDQVLKDVISQNLANKTDGEPVVYDETTVNVRDNSDPCLQSCLCRNRFDISQCRKGNGLIQPDACCGPCQGKPYPTSIKACCDNRIVYDPKISVCCKDRVIKGDICP